MTSAFNEQILSEKLSKLNNTQQCIETLSHWCIFHRSNAEQVVATWDKQFHSAEMVQKVPLLYLANDILQNSKRNGNEFVTEFWKVLPAAIKEVSEKGDDRGKNAVSRLINIWEERKVFGSRAQNLKDVLLGKELPGPLEVGRKRSHSVRIVKRDSRSIRTKLTIGGTAEKIISAFHLVLSEHQSEDEEMNKCKSAVHRVKKMEKDVAMALKKAKDPQRKSLARELEEEEKLLKQCIEKLKVVEANRVALVSELREALNEQESELENVRTQMQVAQAQAQEAGNMRQCLDDENYPADAKLSSTTSVVANANSNGGQTNKTAAAIAAEVADKLAASSSSQYIMSSVLSTFAAEEAKNAGLTKISAASSSFPLHPVNSANSSMLKPENPLPDPSVFMSAQPINPYQLQQVSMQGQVSNSQPQYHSFPNPPSQQLLQPTGGTVSSFHYGSIPPLPPGPPPPATPSYMFTPMVPLTQQQLQMTQQQQMAVGHQQPMPLPQQPPAPPSFRPLTPIQSPGMVYYSNPHHPQ